MKRFLQDKRGIEIKEIVGWAVSIIILVIVLVLFVDVKDASAGAVEYVKNIFRFGR